MCVNTQTKAPSTREVLGASSFTQGGVRYESNNLTVSYKLLVVNTLSSTVVNSCY